MGIWIRNGSIVERGGSVLSCDQCPCGCPNDGGLCCESYSATITVIAGGDTYEDTLTPFDGNPTFSLFYCVYANSSTVNGNTECHLDGSGNPIYLIRIHIDWGRTGWTEYAGSKPMQKVGDRWCIATGEYEMTKTGGPGPAGCDEPTSVSIAITGESCPTTTTTTTAQP